MTTQDRRIESFIKKLGRASALQVATHFSISRQTSTLHLRRLVAAGRLIKQGSTRGSSYHLPRTKDLSQEDRLKSLVLIKKLAGLHEDKVFDEITKRMALKKQLSKSAFDIAYYAFCEMLNNAIDHSKSVRVTIAVQLDKGDFRFSIRDSGIGVFKSVQTHFKLQDEYEAAEHLYKGKQTTDPKNHSGQGIFYTSRIADVFALRSHKLQTVIDNRKEDVYYKENLTLKGTEVQFSVKARSRKLLADLFQQYSNDDFEFDRNVVRVKLSDREQLMSRSQARRLLAGLEKYKRIEFDFNRVKGIGQAFADEIFRVFKLRFPKMQMTYINAGRAVEFMVKRALK